jgi:hypothetical protein
MFPITLANKPDLHTAKTLAAASHGPRFTATGKDGRMSAFDPLQTLDAQPLQPMGQRNGSIVDL